MRCSITISIIQIIFTFDAYNYHSLYCNLLYSTHYHRYLIRYIFDTYNTAFLLFCINTWFRKWIWRLNHMPLIHWNWVYDIMRLSASLINEFLRIFKANNLRLSSISHNSFIYFLFVFRVNNDKWEKGDRR